MLSFLSCFHFFLSCLLYFLACFIFYLAFFSILAFSPDFMLPFFLSCFLLCFLAPFACCLSSLRYFSFLPFSALNVLYTMKTSSAYSLSRATLSSYTFSCLRSNLPPASSRRRSEDKEDRLGIERLLRSADTDSESEDEEDYEPADYWRKTISGTAGKRIVHAAQLLFNFFCF